MDYFKDRILIHTHIEKTAGTSLVYALGDMCGKEHVHDLRPTGTVHPKRMAASQKANIRLLTGHFHFGRMDRHFARGAVYVACVRDPVRRFYSFYKYALGDASHPAHARMHGTFREVVQRHIELEHHSIMNPMTRALSDDVDKDYALVIPSERVNEAIAGLARFFERPINEYHNNVGGYDDTPDEEAVEMILRHNVADRELCEYVNQNFDRWLDTLDKRMLAGVSKRDVPSVLNKARLSHLRGRVSRALQPRPLQEQPTNLVVQTAQPESDGPLDRAGLFKLARLRQSKFRGEI